MVFKRKQKNAVSVFVLNLIEQISMALSLFQTPIAIDETVVCHFVCLLPFVYLLRLADFFL